MTKTSCWRHPAKSLVGVCASCLRERLVELAANSEDRYVSPQRCSFDSNASPGKNGNGDVLDKNMIHTNSKNVVTVSTLMEADQVEAEFRRNNALELQENQQKIHQQQMNMKNRVPDHMNIPRSAVLQRTHSWSHQSSRHNRNAGGYAADAAKILKAKDNSFYGEHSKFEFPDDETHPPKGHIKASSWPEMISHKTQATTGRKGWLRNLFGIRGSKGKDSNSKTKDSNTGRKGLFGLGKKKKSSTASVQDPFEDILSSPWQSGKIDPDEDGFDDGFRQRVPRNDFTNRVTPLSSNGDLYNGTSRLSKMSSVNGRHGSRPPRDHTWSKALSTPLRVFMHKNNVRKSKDELDLEAEEDRRMWGVASPKRFHPSPAFPTSASYTTYYRDYGASWSLHSSPMPGKGRHHQNHTRGRPWENRDAGFHAQHSSPFHAAGSNTWNFYLTPLRPVRSSTSRQHRL